MHADNTYVADIAQQIKKLISESNAMYRAIPVETGISAIGIITNRSRPISINKSIARPHRKIIVPMKNKHENMSLIISFLRLLRDPLRNLLFPPRSIRLCHSYSDIINPHKF